MLDCEAGKPTEPNPKVKSKVEQEPSAKVEALTKIVESLIAAKSTEHTF